MPLSGLNCECCGQELSADFMNNVFCTNRECLVFDKCFSNDWIENRAIQRREKQEKTFHQELAESLGVAESLIKSSNEGTSHPFNEMKEEVEDEDIANPYVLLKNIRNELIEEGVLTKDLDSYFRELIGLEIQSAFDNYDIKQVLADLGIIYVNK